ncbi:MAG: hypothetical protein LBB79_06300 [Prevotellaceae bacterium]|nr:hypothetical protein [Prevotellaceae bacterium]
MERMRLYASYSFIYQAPKDKTTTNAKGEKVKLLSYDVAGVYVIAIQAYKKFVHGKFEH